jgi:hypothetical protein
MKNRLMIIIICCLVWLVPAPSEALTAEEIVLLKKNGVSEETIQMMLQSENHAQALQNGDAGQTMAVRTITRPGGQSAIVYSSGSGDQYDRKAQERLKEEQAWEMLRNLIIVGPNHSGGSGLIR